MNNNMMQNNFVKMNGILGKMEFSHEIYGEGFYTTCLTIQRLSGVTDNIPIMVSEHLVDINNISEGTRVTVTGQFRSHNKHDELINRVLTYVFVREIECAESEDKNQIFLSGYICKPPFYRKTPLGREIADLLLAVNRPYGKSDYIPCIAWGRNSRFASNFEVGCRVQVRGRIQSREYVKRISDTEQETRTTYEVSISKIEVVEDAD